MARILIVDDEVDVRGFVQDVLAPQGHTFSTANNGMEALNQLSQMAFDLVILDRRMPQMGGLEALKKIRAAAETKQLKVLMLTSLGTMAHVDEAFRAGATDYIVKPFDIEKLLTKVKKLTSTS